MIRGTPHACSACFVDHGLRMMAAHYGWQDDSICPICSSQDGQKLDASQLMRLSYDFFVSGTIVRLDFGAAPILQFNELRSSDVIGFDYLDRDMNVFHSALGLGFFNYGPRLWMIGENEPLKDMIGDRAEKQFERILELYPQVKVSEQQRFYRVRKNPEEPSVDSQYDSPPIEFSGGGRFDSKDLQVLYASPDLQTCLHEVRVSAEDDVFVSLLQPTRELKLIDLSVVVEEDNTEFESVDIGMYMLFMAGEVAHDTCRKMAIFLKEHDIDGIIYPSYFSSLRTGAIPFETTYGISNRKFPGMQDGESAKLIPNIALFGTPLAEGKLRIVCKNKVSLRKVEYETIFGPVVQPELDAANKAILEERQG